MSKTIFQLFGEIFVNNDKANKAIDETTKNASESSVKMQNSFKKMGQVATVIGTATVAAGAAFGAWWMNTIESTREYRTEIGKLNTAFQTNNHSAETAQKTYRGLQAILGETDQAVEAANHLALLTDNEKDLSKWVDICTGVYATFGASLPIEGLTEAANETAKVGQVTGPLADALNWAGISEEEFNKKLAACSDEEARQILIMETLNGKYADAAEHYKTTNADVIAANEAQEKLNSAFSEFGRIGEPILTSIKSKVADMVLASVPHFENLVNSIKALGDESAWANSAIVSSLTENLGEPVEKFRTTVIEPIAGWWSNTIVPSVTSAATAVGDFLGIDLVAGWDSVTNAIAGAWQGVIDTVSAAATAVQNFLALEGNEGIGGGDARPWYVRENADKYKNQVKPNAEGAIFSKPTIFDTRLGYQMVGEAGAEAVAPISKLQSYVSDAVRSTVGGMQFNVVLDTGVLVGQLAPGLDAQLGTISSRRGRGN